MDGANVGSNLLGRIYGKLTVMKLDHKQNGNNYWLCRCDCGNEIVVSGAFLRKGITKSCGCPVEESYLLQANPEPFKMEVGQKVRFDPFLDIKGFASELNRGNKVTGTVVYVNHPHKWFSVEFGERKQRISFNYSDIGESVDLCK